MTAAPEPGVPRESAPGVRRTAVLLAAGTAALLVAGVVAGRSQPRSDVGAAQVASLAATPPPVSNAVPVQPGVVPTAVPTTPPARLAVAKIGIDVRVDPVGLDPATGDFAVPPSVDRVGWYRYGPGLEAPAGSIVIAGHVDSAEQGRGAFFRLRDLDRGDTLTVADAQGTVWRFRVVAREEYSKTKIPLARYFARDGAVRLTLITCGGPFDPATRHYRDNIVITAVPLG